MRICVICRFETELDEVVAPVSGGRCVCLRCFNRETQSALPMPAALRRDLIDALSGLGMM